MKIVNIDREIIHTFFEKTLGGQVKWPPSPSRFRVNNIGFKYEPYLCNGFHGLMRKAIGFNDFAIVYIKRNAYTFGI